MSPPLVFNLKASFRYCQGESNRPGSVSGVLPELLGSSDMDIIFDIFLIPMRCSKYNAIAVATPTVIV